MKVNELDRPCAHCRRMHDADDTPVCAACWARVPAKLRAECIAEHEAAPNDSGPAAEAVMDYLGGGDA